MKPLASWATKGAQIAKLVTFCPGFRRACRMPMKGTPKKMRLLKQAQRRMSSTRARTLKGWLLRGPKKPANEKKNKKWLPDCGSTNTPAIHPFKKPAVYKQCMEEAEEVV